MLQDDARDANGARGTVGNASLAGFIAKCFARIPSVDAAERVFAREPPLGKFLADPASYSINESATGTVVLEKYYRRRHRFFEDGVTAL